MAHHSADSSRRIRYRAVAQGELVLETPAHFGAGESDGTELVILQDRLTGAPLIPGASLAGALRHHLLRRERGYRVADDKNTVARRLFGEALDGDKGDQSRIILHDACGQSAQLDLRDGVKIAGDTRTADDGALFFVQTWAKGTTFSLCLELAIYEDDKAEDLKRGFAVLLEALTQGEIPLGARKHRGYGKCRVSAWKLQEFDFQKLDHVIAWLTRDSNHPNSYEAFKKRANQFEDVRREVTLDATFALQDSMMIRSSGGLVDHTHLRDGDGTPLLSGTSLAGALRARALKITKSFYESEKAESLIDDLFGLHGDKKTSSRDLTASRLRVAESLVKEADMTHIQNRVKIDRFTGGAFETALISEHPAFATPQTQVTMNLMLQLSEGNRYEEQQVGLLLLLLKDLWTEDLPLGGESSIGRGRLRGLKATVKIGTPDDVQVYPFNEEGLVDPSQARDLQRYVDSLWKE